MHSFVGVCSNCHVVLAIRPSGTFMKKAMSRAYSPLLGTTYSPEQISRGGAMESDRRELYRNIWGFIALVLLCASSIYVVVRMLMRGDPKRYKGRFQVRKWFTVDEWASSAFFSAALETAEIVRLEAATSLLRHLLLPKQVQEIKVFHVFHR